MPQVITLCTVNARRTPGWIRKDIGDIVVTLNEDVVLDVYNTFDRDSLTWVQSTWGDGDIWVATFSPKQRPLLVAYFENENIFDKLFRFILKHEGGYLSAEDAIAIGDIGGETKFGISKRSYPHLDVSTLSLMDAKGIYKKDYWDAAGCNYIPDPLNAVHFDTAVNCGIGKANEFLSKCNGDSIAYLNMRREFYMSLNSPQFIEGWMARVDELQRKFC